jgi:hypothetical protein
MNYKKFSRIYSISRVSRYQKAANGNKKKAMAMYYANARMAQAFQPLISFFEVVLRNQLHYALAHHFSLCKERLDYVEAEIKRTEKIINS